MASPHGFKERSESEQITFGEISETKEPRQKIFPREGLWGLANYQEEPKPKCANVVRLHSACSLQNPGNFFLPSLGSGTILLPGCHWFCDGVKPNLSEEVTLLALNQGCQT